MNLYDDRTDKYVDICFREKGNEQGFHKHIKLTYDHKQNMYTNDNDFVMPDVPVVIALAKVYDDPEYKIVNTEYVMTLGLFVRMGSDGRTDSFQANMRSFS